jgi:hypothetical protein
MGNRLIVQPNGKFAVFSHFTDDLEAWDCTIEELVAYYRACAADEAEERTREWCAGPRPGRGHYTIEEAIEWVRDVHGDEEAEKARKKMMGEDNESGEPMP